MEQTDWIKLHRKMLADSKCRQLSDRQYRVFVGLLLLASREEDRAGEIIHEDTRRPMSISEIGHEIGVEVSGVKRAVRRLIEVGIISRPVPARGRFPATLKVENFSKYQTLRVTSDPQDVSGSPATHNETLRVTHDPQSDPQDDPQPPTKPEEYASEEAPKRRTRDTSTDTPTPTAPNSDAGLFEEGNLEPPQPKPKRPQQIWAERVWAAYGLNENPPGDLFAAVQQWIDKDEEDPPLEKYVLWLEKNQPRLPASAKPKTAIPAKLRKHRARDFDWNDSGSNDKPAEQPSLYEGAERNMREGR